MIRLQKRLIATPAASVLSMLEVVEGLVFFLDFFRAAIASGLVTVHVELPLAVAEACNPQRLREENAELVR